MKKRIIQIFLFFVFLSFLIYAAFGEEYIYLKTVDRAKYTIEVELVTGTKKVITTTRPVGTHFQINSSRTYYLACIPNKDDLIFGRHWQSVRRGVIDFKILKVENF